MQRQSMNAPCPAPCAVCTPAAATPSRPARGLRAALAVAAMTLALPAAAQFQKPEDAIKYRRAAFTLLGTHVGRLGAMAQGKVPFDAKAAADNATIAEQVSRLPYVAFLEGTDKGDTKAKPDIWKNWDKFRASAVKMQEEVAKLAATARSPGLTLDQLKAAMGPVGQSCKGCHDDFKNQ
jgi:cytochrome c556